MSPKLIRHFLQTIVIVIVICVNVGNTGPVIHDEYTSQKTLRLLEQEAEQTGNPFKQAWIRSKNSYDEEDKDKLKEYEDILNEGEMRIIIAYTYENPRFYEALNKDIRDHFSDLSNQKYPQATRILSIALKKLGEFQRESGLKLPKVIYRKEKKSIVLPDYKKFLNSGKLGVLKQFTSTSRSKDNTVNTGDTSDRDETLTTFDNPKVGADIHAFSKYPEEEFLLPYNVKYKVKSISKDGEATLEGPTNTGDTKASYINTGFHLETSYSLTLFSVLVYIWINETI